MKRPMSITVRGRTGEWSFPFHGDPAHLAEWRADGLEVHEVEARIPAWAAALGLAAPWARAQVCWQWLRLW